MSGLVNKVKDVLHPEKTTTTTTTTTTKPHGHGSSTTHNAAEPRTVAPTGTHAHDGTYTTGGNYTHGTDGPATTTDGPHKSNLLNKADPRVDSDRDYSHNAGVNPQGNASTGNNAHTTTGGFGTAGHSNTHGAPVHSNHTANVVDPRVNTASNTHSTGTTGGFGTTGHSTAGAPVHSTTGAPVHSNHTSNVVDPRVNTASNTHNTHTTGTTGGFGTTGHSTTHGAPEGTYGAHNSRMANAADPRIDSDLDGSRNVGGHNNTYGTTTTGHTGTTGGFGTTGHSTTHGAPVHSNHTANVADPRVNTASNTTHTGTHTGPHTTTHTAPHNTGHAAAGVVGGTHATGPAPSTAGPHKSDMMNKADPRVDSDLNGSKTYGGDKTFAQ